jgi:hypothetical protein
MIRMMVTMMSVVVIMIIIIIIMMVIVVAVMMVMVVVVVVPFNPFNCHCRRTNLLLVAVFGIGSRKMAAVANPRFRKSPEAIWSHIYFFSRKLRWAQMLIGFVSQEDGRLRFRIDLLCSFEALRFKRRRWADCCDALSISIIEPVEMIR